MAWTQRVVVSVASVVSGVMHYDIWANHGYQDAPVRELFVLQAVAAVVAGVVVLIPRAAAAVPAVATSAASLAAFVLSRTVGVPTFHGSFRELGLQPSDARVAGVPATLVILLAEGLALTVGSLILVRRVKRTSE